jgi:hypothetical protein
LTYLAVLIYFGVSKLSRQTIIKKKAAGNESIYDGQAAKGKSFVGLVFLF